MNLRENVPLAPLTTLGVGGPARYLVDVRSEAEVEEAMDFARSRSLPLFVLGGGSNLVVADSGFAGVVLKIGMAGVTHHEERSGIIFTAGAGVDWDDFVAQTVAADCAGLECLSGIPGSVGGTPVQNVGAYGQEVSGTIREVRVLDTQTMRVEEFSNAECGFSYRSSIFNTSQPGRYIILDVSFGLERGGSPCLHYADLQNYFAGRRHRPSLSEVRAAVREIRHNKAMLIVPGEEDSRSAGSFFKNALLPQARYDELRAQLKSRGLDLPSYPAGNGYCKLPAAWLVEHAGFPKGYVKGRAAISRKHALAIVNRGEATAAEIISLKNEIQVRVRQEFGIDLQSEPVLLGF